MHAGAPIGVAAVPVYHFDLLEQSIILPPASAFATPTPRVVPATGHAIHPTHGTDAQFIPVLLYEREDFAFRSEQNRMAFFRISCSSLSLA